MPRSAVAQRAAGPPPTLPTLPTLPGGLQDDRDRLAQLLGIDSTAGFLARSASSRLPVRSIATPRGSLGAARLVALPPQMELRWQSALPAAENDGLLWAGRGASVLARAGALFEVGPLRAVFLPEIAYTQNRPFDILPSTVPGRSPYAAPFHTGTAPGDAPIDLPLRFGDRPRTAVGGGQSSVSVSYGSWSVGVGTENEWWGPGAKTALVLSTAAGGFPHGFARTARPIRTRVGAIEGRLLWGALTPSAYFDSGLATQHRSFSGAIVTLRPAALPALTVGIERTVVRDAPSAAAAAGRAIDALVIWEPPPSDADERARADGAPTGREADQLTGLVARLVDPASRVEVYAEWVRQELPRSLREFLLAPQTSQGYTVGVQWASAEDAVGHSRLRIQGEAVDVEQSVTIRGLAIRDFYTGFATRAGYTQRGQPLGAATGPGSSSQRLGADLVARDWQGGIFAARVRWDNDALYRQPTANFFRHDVSLTAGVRGAVRLGHWDVGGEASYTDRINFLFQNGFNNPGGVRTVDVHDLSVAMSLTPR